MTSVPATPACACSGQLRFDIVKIDLSLVQGGAVRATSQEVVRTLKDLADRWGALVIAEGVETPEQLTFVRSLGIRAGQGYLLGRPAETRPRPDRPRAAGTAAGDWLVDRMRVARHDRHAGAPPMAREPSRTLTAPHHLLDCATPHGSLGRRRVWRPNWASSIARIADRVAVVVTTRWPPRPHADRRRPASPTYPSSRFFARS